MDAFRYVSESRGVFNKRWVSTRGITDLRTYYISKSPGINAAAVGQEAICESRKGGLAGFQSPEGRNCEHPPSIS